MNCKKAIIVGGNVDEIDLDWLKSVADYSYVVCADRGYLAAENCGITPDIILGDFDSAPYPNDAKCQKVKLPTEKDDTDLHYAARLLVEKGFKDISLTGVTGGRIDQTIATMHTLNFLSLNGAKAKVVDIGCRIYFVNSEITLNRPEHSCYLSLFPFGGRAEGVTLDGAFYPLKNATLNNDFPIGVSNEFDDDVVKISVNSGSLLVMIVKK